MLKKPSLLLTSHLTRKEKEKENKKSLNEKGSSTSDLDSKVISLPDNFDEKVVEVEAKVDSSYREDRDNYLDCLNEEQLHAIQHDGGPLAILATAGSGKTRTIISRIVHMIRNRGVKPENILAITFTREATREMRERIEKILQTLDGITITNFHQLCLKIVKENFHDLGFEYPPIVLGAFEQREVVKICLMNWIRQSNHDLQSIIEESSQFMEGRDFHSPETFLNIDSRSKNSFSTQFAGFSQTNKLPENVISYFISSIANIKDGQVKTSFLTESQVQIFKQYVNYLKNMTAIDFSDMIPLCIKLFEQKPNLLAKYQQKYRYILCDEFQDVSSNQFQFLRLLSEIHKNICVVGDDDQTIYGWRGAIVGSFKLFQDTFPNAVTVYLSQTYRSTGFIVSAMSALISKNTCRLEKKIWTKNQEGSKVHLVVAESISKETRQVAQEIKRLTSEQNVKFHDIAILCRTQRVVSEFQNALQREDLPIQSGTAPQGSTFSMSKEVRDVLSYCILALNEETQKNIDDSFARVCNIPPRGFSRQLLDSIRDLSNLRKISLIEACKKTMLSSASKKQGDVISGFFELINSLKCLKNNSSSVYVFLNTLIEKIGYMDFVMKQNSKNPEKANMKIAIVKSFLNHSKTYSGSLENFVQSVNLFGDSQSFTSIELDQIVVTTIHQAKGREWPFVFIVRFNDGCIPLISSTSKDEKSEKEISQILEEERRLAFVGMSRPSKNLYISFSKCDYDGSPIIPSRFLSEIPDDLVQIAERAFDRTKMQSSKRLLESNDTESAIKKREI